jgi:hypothetical protein
MLGIGLTLRKEKGRRWGRMVETPSTAMVHAPCVVTGRTHGRSTCMVQGERPSMRHRQMAHFSDHVDMTPLL